MLGRAFQSDSAVATKARSKEKIRHLDELFDMTDAEILACFKKFHGNFLRAFNSDSLVHLNLLTQEVQNHVLPSEAIFQKFISMRLSAQKLRSAFMFFDVDHRPPKSLHKLVKRMGKLKDALIAGEGYVEPARKLEKHLRKMDSFYFEFDFVPTNARGLSVFFSDQMKEAKEILELGEPQPDGSLTLSAKPYHVLRKLLRNHLWYLEFMRNDLEIKGIKKLRRTLKTVNQLMGDKHDKLEQKKYQGEFSKEAAVLTVSPLILDVIEARSVSEPLISSSLHRQKDEIDSPIVINS